MPTKQETFDTVVSHLRRQGRCAMDRLTCVYRAENGDRCAAGCLIPDDLYSSNLEGLSVSSHAEDGQKLERTLTDYGWKRRSVTSLGHEARTEADGWFGC